MAIGRISGSVLKSNLTRNGVDLAFETNLLYLDVTNARIGIGTSEPTTTLDVSGTVNATAFTGDGSGLTGINVSTNIQLVGDDSTGTILGTGETFKIAGGNNITTAVSDDTLTVTGSKDINVNSITSDDSTAIQINDNINIAGNILPTTTLTYNLGSTDYRFNELWLAGTTIDLGGTKLSIDGSGDFEVKDSGGTRKNIVADSVLIGSGVSKIKLSRGNNGKLKFTDENDADTGILTIVGDDSTGVDLNSGETIKIAGAGGVTTAVSGDTLTITGPNLSSYATTAYVDAQNTAQALTFVGDDSTGTAVNSGETFKIAGATGITTAVSGDTLTITGPDLTSYATTAYVDAQNTAQALTFVGDDSTGTAVNSGETFKIVGAGGVTTAVSGDTLTITGPTGTLSNIVEDTTPQLGGSLDVNGNSIVSTSNGNIVFDPDGTGVIQVNADVIPETDLTVSLGSPTKRFADAYFGAGTVYIGDNSITSTDDGIVFSAPISTTTGTLTRVSDDNTAIVKEKIGIRTDYVTIDSFDTSTNTGALYYTLTNDEVNQELTMSKVLLTQDTSDAYTTFIGHTTGNQTSNVTFDADVNNGSVRLRLKGNSQINSTKFYKIPLGNETTTATSGRTATINYGTLVADSSTYNIDSWAKSSARAVKYIISSKGLTSGITQVDELLVVHDGTESSYTRYNFIRSNGTEALVVFSATIVGDNVVLQAYADTSESVDIKLHKTILSDDNTAATFDNVAVLSSQAVTSSTTTIDSFEFSKYNGAFYLILGSDSTNGMYSISEIYVSSDETDAYVSVGPTLAMDGNVHLSFTASLSGSRVLLKCASDTGSTTNVVCYRIGLYRGPAGGDFTSSVTLDTAQTISGAKTFTAGVLTDTIQSPSSNADLTIDASGTGAVQILTQKVIMANLPTSDPSVAGQLWNNAGVLNISAG